VDDTQIADEIDAQINSGTLPAPDADTLFMTYFPPGITITHGTYRSCAPGGFCAYHSTYSRHGQSTFYGVIPDNSEGSGCEQGCGSGTAFEKLCTGSSHEMTEAITDAEIGIASGAATGSLLGWYDANNGEIGDICEGITTLLGGYAVQKEWSNEAKGCVAGRLETQDFSVAFSPLSLNIAAGGMQTVSIQTQITSGSPGTLNLSITGLPSGVAGSLSQASVTAGQSATLTLTAAAGAGQAKQVPLTIAASGAATHTASTLLDVTPAPTGDFSPRVATGGCNNASPAPPAVLVLLALVTLARRLKSPRRQLPPSPGTQ
jgi:hypothetical protein